MGVGWIKGVSSFSLNSPYQKNYLSKVLVKDLLDHELAKVGNKNKLG
jgi:hypothetical protein